MTANYWQDLDQDRLGRFGPTDRHELAAERHMTDTAYDGTAAWDEACHTAGCGGTLQYRDTVGAMQCPGCGELATTAGSVIRAGTLGRRHPGR